MITEEDILNGKIDLSTISLKQFREGRTIYSSKKEAQSKGFEAHHLVPISIQMKNIGFKKNRSEFEIQFKDKLDDRCLRLTRFEHIIDHFLMAKEDSSYITLFENMVNYNFNFLLENQKELLNRCIEFSNLREQGFKKSIQTQFNTRKNNGYYNLNCKWYNNGMISKCLPFCPDGWVAGCLTSQNKKHYTNGSINLFTEQCPEGFWNGITCKKRDVKGNKNQAFGKHWYNNGTETLYLNPDIDNIPDGFKKGYLKDIGKNWYTNGTQNIRSSSCPEGFWKGLTQKKKRK